MKEVTYKEWVKNPKPRMMWVWDFEDKIKKQLKVTYVSKEDITYPVVALTNNDINLIRYRHCAEIEKLRRMTHKELSRWLREKPTREYKYKDSDDYIYGCYEYKECRGDEEIPERIKIREDDGKWREPLVEE